MRDWIAADGKILKMWGEQLFAWPHGIRVGETVPGTTLTGQPGGHIVRKLAKVK